MRTWETKMSIWRSRQIIESELKLKPLLQLLLQVKISSENPH